MTRPSKLERATIDGWLGSHPGWAVEDVGGQAVGSSIAKRFTFPDFSAAMAFAVRVGMLAEKHDHHPDILVGWGKATVLWTTHDAGGITELDLALAAGTDALLP